MTNPVELIGVSAGFTAHEVECLVRTAAELWAAAGHPAHGLSARQQELAERAHARLADNAEGRESREVPGAGTAFTISAPDLEPFSIDNGAFHRWIAAADDWEHSAPHSLREGPAGDLADLIRSAIDHAVLAGDPRLELQINGDDNPYHDAGFYVLLSNANDDHSLAAITSGWTELTYPHDENPSLARTVRFHLEHVCGEANWLLAYIRNSSTNTTPERASDPSSRTPLT